MLTTRRSWTTATKLRRSTHRTLRLGTSTRRQITRQVSTTPSSSPRITCKIRDPPVSPDRQLLYHPLPLRIWLSTTCIASSATICCPSFVSNVPTWASTTLWRSRSLRNTCLTSSVQSQVWSSNSSFARRYRMPHRPRLFRRLLDCWRFGSNMATCLRLSINCAKASSKSTWKCGSMSFHSYLLVLISKTRWSSNHCLDSLRRLAWSSHRLWSTVCLWRRSRMLKRGRKLQLSWLRSSRQRSQC